MLKNVLIISEHEKRRLMLSHQIDQTYNVIYAENTENAICILNDTELHISVVLLDVDEGELVGLSTLKKLRSNSYFQSIPIIVLIEKSDHDLVERVVEFGANGVLCKPYSNTLLLNRLRNVIGLCENAASIRAFEKDKLTRLLKRDAFFEECDERIRSHEPGYYVLSCFDIDNFKVINDQYGISVGDEVLKYVADCIRESIKKVDGVACRVSGDRFAILYPTASINSEHLKNSHKKVTLPTCIGRAIRIRIGRCVINDVSLCSNVIFERATMAEESIKGRYDLFIADYCDSMRTNLLKEQKIVTEMDHALASGSFIPFLQPQYNHSTGALIGAEALVRWKTDQGFVSPGEFIPIFEKNGFVYELDKYIWERVCILLRKWLDEGYNPLPVSVNISRFDLYRSDFFDVVCGLVKKYDIPTDLLRLEITESALADSPEQILNMVNRLIEYGFTVEIDDFGSGYSSLNTLKDVQATILKLDMKFFENTKNSQRSGNIIESVVRMAKWLGMAVIAEGVEEKEQADFLKSIGCYYIQGFYYARPMPIREYEQLIMSSNHEPKLTRIKALASLDNNEFWNPKSMETLIFNSYVGGACIFEYDNGKTELLRANDQYIKSLGKIIPKDQKITDMKLVNYLDDANKKKLKQLIHKAFVSKKEASSELKLVNSKKDVEYIRFTMRMIASTGERHLFYCVTVNMTKQRISEQKRYIAEHKENESAQRLRVIMSNINGGVSAILIDDNGKSTYVFNNERYYELYGYTKEQAEEEKLDVMSLIVPEDLPSVMEKINQLKKDRKPVVIDYRCKKRDGELVYLRANSSMMWIEGYGNQVITSVVTDITEQRLLSDQLHAIVNNINGGVSATKLKKGTTEFMVVNDRFFEILGYTREEYEAECKDKFFHLYPEDRERVINLYKESAKNKKSYTLEYRIVRKDGAIRWIQCNISVICIFGVDEPIQLAVANDITEEKEANDQLTILNSVAHEIVEQTEHEHVIELTLQRVLDYFESDRSYIVEMDYGAGVSNNTYEICGPGVKPQKGNLQNVPLNMSAGWFQTLNNKEYVYIEHVDEMDESEAEVRQMLLAQDIHCIILAPLFQKGQLIGFVGVDNPSKSMNHIGRLKALGDYINLLLLHRDLNKIIQDKDKQMISLRERSSAMDRKRVIQRALSAMMQVSKDYLYVKDKNLDYICCSESAARLQGLSKRNEIVGKNDFDLFDMETANRFYETDQKVLSGGKATMNYVEKVPDSNGNIHYTNTSKFPIMGANGKVIAIYCSGHDVTDVREKESQLQLLTSSIPGGLAAFTMQENTYKMLYFNEGFYKFSGYSREEFVEMTNQKLLALVYDEDQKKVQDHLDKILAGHTDNSEVSCEYRCHTKDGGYRWMGLKGRLTKHGKDNYVINVVQIDISEQKGVEENLRLAEEEYRLALKHSGRAISRYNVTERTLTSNSDVASRLNMSECVHDIPNSHINQGLISPDTKDAYLSFYQDIIDGKREGTAMFQKKFPEGWRWLKAHSTTIFSKNGDPVSAIISYEDITDQYEKEAIFTRWHQSIEEKKDDTYTMFRCDLSKNASFESCKGSLLSFDFNKMKSSSLDECTEMYAEQNVYEEDYDKYVSSIKSDKLIADFYRGNRSLTLEYREIVPPNSVRWIRRSIDIVERPDSAGIMAYLMFENIDERKKAELNTKILAETDALTGLLNRVTFARKLNERIQNRKENTMFALFLLDLDGFKLVNDTFGHAVGDQVLIDAGKVLRSVVRDYDLVGRLGGDEFIVCLCDVPMQDKSVILKKARQIWTLTHKVFDLDVRLSASVGIALCPDDGTLFDDLYQKADKALYQIKENGKDNYGFYSESNSSSDTKLNELETKKFISGNMDIKKRMLIVDDTEAEYKNLNEIFADEFQIECLSSSSKALNYLRRNGPFVSVILLNLLNPQTDGFTILGKLQQDTELQSIPVIVVSQFDDQEMYFRAMRCGACDYITLPVNRDLLRFRVRAAISKSENEHLRVREHYLALLRQEAEKYRSILKDNGTIIIEYDKKKNFFLYDPMIEYFLAGSFNDRPLWDVLFEDKTAAQEDIVSLHELFDDMLQNKQKKSTTTIVPFLTPSGKTHSFQVKILNCKDTIYPDEKMMLIFTDNNL